VFFPDKKGLFLWRQEGIFIGENKEAIPQASAKISHHTAFQRFSYWTKTERKVG